MSTRILPEFELLMPESLDEAVRSLDKLQEDVAVLAGGTDLLVMMKSGFRPEYVLSLNAVPDLSTIQYDPWKGLEIGARVTLAETVESALIKEHYPALRQSAAANGSSQTRQMGTVVGNVMRASPSGDCCCALLALGASVVLRGPDGTRDVPLDDFWIDYRVTARKPNELAIAVVVPPSKTGTYSAFDALTRTKLDLSKVNAAVWLEKTGETCTKARVAVGAVAPTTVRLPETEALVRGAELTETLLQQVEQTVAQEISPIDDVRSTAEYRRTVTGVLVRRILETLMK